MIKPTVGRVVWVSRPKQTIDPKQPEVGLITYVIDDRTIHVTGFNPYGQLFSLNPVSLLQDDDAKPEGDFACWMPYQVGQAAKAAAEPDKPATTNSIPAASSVTPQPGQAPAAQSSAAQTTPPAV